MVATTGMKNKSETMLEEIRGLVLDFVLYFLLYFYIKSTLYSLHVTSAQSKT